MPSPGEKRGRLKKEEDVPDEEQKVVKKKKKTTSQRGTSSKSNSKSDGKTKATRQASSARPSEFNLDDIKPHKEMLKIVSWNVNGIKSLLEKYSDFLKSYLKKEMPDLLCLQETKISTDKKESMDKELKEFFKDAFEEEASRFKFYWNCCSTKKGYSGTLLISKIEPIHVDFEDIDGDEGRAVIAEFPNAFIVNTYVPNSGMKLDRLKYRTEEWDPKMREKLDALNKEKAVIWCGDLNVAHSDSDVANWKKKRNKCPGFCDMERENFGILVGGDGNEITDLQRTKRTLPLGRPGPKDGRFMDVWKSLYPEEEGFTFWGYRMNSRGKNNGWRLDYFVLSKDVVPKVVDCVRRNELWGPSDHIPVVLLMKNDTLV